MSEDVGSSVDGKWIRLDRVCGFRWDPKSGGKGTRRIPTVPERVSAGIGVGMVEPGRIEFGRKSRGREMDGYPVAVTGTGQFGE